MNGRPRPWWRSTYVVLAAAVLLAAGLVTIGSTLANFSAETDNATSTLPSGWIGPATGLGVTPSGYDAQLAWTPGTHGPVTGQTLYSQDNGSSSTCPASGYSLVANMASASTASYTDSHPDSTTLAANIETPNLLNANINSTVTSLAVKNNASFAFTASFTIQIDSEQMTVTAQSGAGNKTWTVTRGVNGTTAAAHLANAAVTQISVSVVDASGFPGAGSFTIEVGAEQMTVTSGQGTTSWTVTRAANSTTAAAHASGTLVTQIPDPLDGHYYCYRMVSKSATSWTATASFPATQMGLVATNLAITNANVGTFKTGDTFVVTYNQQPSLTALANAKICAVWAAGTAPVAVTIFLEYTTCATTNTAYQVEITGFTHNAATAGSSTANLSATVSGSAPWTVTYTLTGNMTNNILVTPGTGTAIPDGTGQYVKSAAITDAAPACTSATYNCQPSATSTH